jgi:hypothetical protein
MNISKKLLIMLATASLLAPTGAQAEEIPPPETAQFVAVSLLGGVTCTGETSLSGAGVIPDSVVTGIGLLVCTGNLSNLSSTATQTAVFAGADEIARGDSCQPGNLVPCGVQYDPEGQAAVLTIVADFQMNLRDGFTWDYAVGHCPIGPYHLPASRYLSCRAGHAVAPGIPT